MPLSNRTGRSRLTYLWAGLAVIAVISSLSAIAGTQAKSPPDKFGNFVGLTAHPADPILADAISLSASKYKLRPGIVESGTVVSGIDRKLVDAPTFSLAALPRFENLEIRTEPSERWSLPAKGQAADESPYRAALPETLSAYAPPGSAERIGALFLALGYPMASGSVVWPDGAGEHLWAANEQRCLAEAIYFEARGEPLSGQLAVAQVVVNRLKSRAYPDTVCGVVYQNERMLNRCQFSFACDGRPEQPTNRRAWASAKALARDVLHGDARMPELGSATHFHATHVEPTWARSMQRITQIGLHVFYGA